MKRTFNTVIAMTLCLLILLPLLTSCSRSDDDGTDHVFRVDLPGNPRTLDPQTAVDANSRAVISNLFSGLLRMDKDGNVVPDVAWQYDVYDEGKTYVFHLREDVYWRDKGTVDEDGNPQYFMAACTAYDFVFAFQRLFNPAVKSRNAADYYCILRSERVHSGELPLDRLGVRADGDYTLVIELNEPNPDFPVLLTAPPAYPCNEQFYILASGRYGLTDRAVASNGGFYLRDWVYDPWWTDENRIVLRRHNLNNNEERPVYPRGVNFLMDRTDENTTVSANFMSGETDCLVLSGDGVNTLVRRSYPHTISETSTWGLIFSESGVFANVNRRLAVAYATDTDAIGIKQTGFRKADGIIPDSIKIGDDFYRDIVGKPIGLDISGQTAMSYMSMTAELTRYPVLIMPAVNDTAVESFVRSVAQQWQEKISMFCRIEVLTAHEYALRLADGDYDIAAVCLTAAYNSPTAIFKALGGSASTVLEALRDLTAPSGSAGSADFADFESYLALESELMQSGLFIPICYMTDYFFTHKKSEGLVYNPYSRTVDFRGGLMR